MSILPADRFHRWGLLIFLVLFSVSCIKPAYLHDFILQHVLTVLAVLVLIVTDEHFRLSRFSYALTLLFLTFHLIGARYLYSFVPYDDWTKTLFGFEINRFFGFSRNHYDRFVHFAYGVLMTVPLRELLLNRLKLPAVWASLFAVVIIVATGGLYEMAEWGIAMILSPETAEIYNGQQGDIWDPQRDTSLALSGSLLVVTGFSLLWRVRSPR